MLNQILFTGDLKLFFLIRIYLCSLSIDINRIKCAFEYDASKAALT